MTRQFSLLDALLEEPPKALTVSQLTGKIKQVLEGRFQEVWVEGEISNFKIHGSGHWYFTLKDSGASVRCASFRGTNRYIRFRPDDGLLVRVRGRLALYEPRGEYQILVSAVEPVGVGALQLAFDQLKERLAAEQLFDPQRKRPIPAMPRTVGVVTSRTGAALQDILRVLRRRNRAVGVLVAPARVQGEGAGIDVAHSIRLLSNSGRVDVIIVGRGGGSLEDLWAFNEEAVARAIAASSVPVISAVGHETDFTISDFVADLRAPTPSAAAEIVSLAAQDLRETIATLRKTAESVARYRVLDAQTRVRNLRHSPAVRAVPNRLARYVQASDEAREVLVDVIEQRLSALRTAMASASSAVASAEPRRRILVDRARVREATVRLESVAWSAVDDRRNELAAAAGRLSSLSPLDVLSRGYAIVRADSGTVVRRARDVARGERLRIRVGEGELIARRIDDAPEPGSRDEE